MSKASGHKKRFFGLNGSKGHKSHFTLYDLRTLRPPLQKGWAFFMCVDGKQSHRTKSLEEINVNTYFYKGKKL